MDIDAGQSIYAAVTELMPQFAGWVPMGAVREVSGVNDRELFDTTVVALYALGVVGIVPEDNQKTITGADDYNGVRIPGGEVQHLINLG